MFSPIAAAILDKVASLEQINTVPSTWYAPAHLVMQVFNCTLGKAALHQVETILDPQIWPRYSLGLPKHLAG